MTGSLAWPLAVSRCRSQCTPVAPVTATSIVAASAHTTVAAARRPGNCPGSDAAATATIPVPMTAAYQFGVKFAKT
jgi:hypothetical protein